MIKLSENKTALVNLGVTIKAIENIQRLIECYSEDKPGPAYCIFNYVSTEYNDVQFQRSIIVEALEKQKQHLVDYMTKLGIDVNL